jgi:hypothetical protein
MNAVRTCLTLTVFLLTTSASLQTGSSGPGCGIMAMCKSSLNRVATPSAETSRG